MSPVVGTIIEGPSRMPFYTDLQRVFRALGGREQSFGWLLSDVECPRLPRALSEAESNRLIPGSNLSSVIMGQTDPLQFEWAVLSRLPPGSTLDVTDLKVTPYADGDPLFWEGVPDLQAPGALVELVCWDSTATILITRDEV
jgi:hypothetical protein